MRQLSAGQSAGHEQTRSNIGSATNDCQRCTLCRIDVAHSQALGIRMALDGQHFADDHACKRRCRGGSFLDFEPDHREPLCERVAR